MIDPTPTQAAYLAEEARMIEPLTDEQWHDKEMERVGKYLMDRKEMNRNYDRP